MTSPLLQYANAYVKVTAKGAVTTVNGRFTAASGNTYLVQCFLKRQQYSGVTSGSSKQPRVELLEANRMPGASGDSFYYRGYALRYSAVTASYDPQVSNPATLTWTDVTASPTWLRPGSEAVLFLGASAPMKAHIERSSGVFGGRGIDQLLYAELGGVELQLVGAEVLD